MVQINFGQREVSCKIVFYGPGMSGKTTNLEIIHQKAPKQAVGEMVSIATETDRTLYFDFMPMDLGQVAGMHTKFMLYTVPGQIYYNATRKLVLQGVDGIIFVADSDPKKMPENVESIQNLRDNLAEMGLKPEDLPMVLQYNKRDLPNATPIPELTAKLNTMNAPVFEAVAREGKGVFATLKEVSRLVIEKLNKEHAPASNRRRTAASLTPPQTGAPPVAPAAAPPSAAATPARALPAVQPAPASSSSGASLRPGAPKPPGSSSGHHPGMPKPAPAQQRPPSGARPSATTVSDDQSARERHLAKSKPPALAGRAAGSVDLGSTDPMLKRYQMARHSSSSMMSVLLMVLVGLVISLLLLLILTLFVRPVRALLPPGLQHRIEQMVGDNAASAQAAAGKAVQPAATPAAATPPQAAPAVSGKPAIRGVPAATPPPVAGAPASQPASTPAAEPPPQPQPPVAELLTAPPSSAAEPAPASQPAEVQAAPAAPAAEAPAAPKTEEAPNGQ